MAFRFKTHRTAVRLPTFHRPIIAKTEEEVLTGSVQGMKASAPEERLAKSLDEAGLQYIFRYSVGAPRGMPGWKEVDFLVMSSGIVYANEVDTAFTHRSKEEKDKLHDAIILNDKNIQAMGTVWPQVFHTNGDTELADKRSARSYVRMRYGK